jgi:hypothetical protein
VGEEGFLNEARELKDQGTLLQKINLKLAKFTFPKAMILYLQCNEKMTSAFKYWVNGFK